MKMEKTNSEENNNGNVVENIKKWSMKKKILTGISLIIAIWIIWSIFGGVNASTRAILELSQGSIEVQNQNSTSTLEIRIGNGDSKFSGVNPDVVKKNVLFSASEYPASAPFEIKNVRETIEVALFDKKGNILNVTEVEPNTQETIEHKKEYQYVLMADKGYFKEKGVSVENNSKLLIDTLEKDNK